MIATRRSSHLDHFRPRPKQRVVINYRGGKMGVSAVPGSGKTWTLSFLAARLVAEGGLGDDQEVLIVTLVNSAVENFAARVAKFLGQRYDLLDGIGYRVRTLHGLCHDIVRENPARLNLGRTFEIVDEGESARILRDVLEQWLTLHGEMLADRFLRPDLSGARENQIRRHHWPEILKNDIVLPFIKQAKDLELTPREIARRIAYLPSTSEADLLRMAAEVYADYERALHHRGAVDFSDLMRLAMQLLRQDEALLRRLRHRWPYVLEDEAQDSSRLQEELLRLLVGPEGNWVRVGDPNQAIYETFTTASPRFLRDFLEEEDVFAADLPNSGRSTRSIIDLANELIRWTMEEHPVEPVREALAPPFIEPAPPGDPQPNPPDESTFIHLSEKPYKPEEEIEAVARSLARWLPEHPQMTVAVLVPRNERGAKMVEALRRRNLPVVELLKTTHSTRAIVGVLMALIAFLDRPQEPKRLAALYEQWASRLDPVPEAADRRAIVRLLQQNRYPERFLVPATEDWLERNDLPDAARHHLDHFRRIARRWLEASALPIDQLLLTAAQDLFRESSDLALVHKIALMLRGYADLHPDFRFADFHAELKQIAGSRRNLIGFGEDDLGFDPDRHRGEVVVATIHKAKGLEWDRVYLLSVNSYDYPSALEADQETFIAERWFVRDKLNLQAEVLAQLKALPEAAEAPFLYVEGEATRAARFDYAAERLRLLYVGITRARRELIITWNTGKRGATRIARALEALIRYRKERVDV